MKIIDTFQNRLNCAISNSNLKKIEIAKRAGISKSLLTKYSTGISEAGSAKLLPLALALDVSPVWLMGYDVPVKFNVLDKIRTISNNNIEILFTYLSTDEIRQIASISISLNDDNQKRVLEYAKLVYETQFKTTYVKDKDLNYIKEDKNGNM